MARWKAENETVQWSFQKDMGVGSLGWRASAYHHILRLFIVKQSLRLIFFRSIVYTLRYDRSKLRDCCAQIGAIGAENVYPIIKEP